MTDETPWMRLIALSSLRRTIGPTGNEKGANPVRSYVAFIVSAGLLLASLAVVLVVHGGWEAAAAGFALVIGPLFVGSFIVLGAAADRGAGPR
jgi:hypothetical protein